MKLPPCPAVVCNKLPGGVRGRLLEGEQPSLTRLMRAETEGHDDLIDPDLFAGIGQQPLVEYGWPDWDGPPNLFPMLYTDASLIAAAYAVPLSQLRPLLPKTRRLRPVRVTPWHGALFAFAFDYRRSGLGSYHEFGLAVPMLLDAPLRPPLWPLLRDMLSSGSDPALGMMPIERAVDRERACEAGTRLYGLPKMLGQADFALGHDSGLASVSQDGARMAALEVIAPKTVPARRMNLSCSTLTVREGRIIRVRYAALAEGYRGARGEAKLEFGEHPRFTRYQSLTLSPRPLESRVCPRVNWIIGGPEDLGDA